MKLNSSAPHFFVSDLMKSVRYYVDVLGFDEPKLWGEPPTFAMPSKDGFIVMLNQSHHVTPHPNGPEDGWDAYFWGTGVDDYFESIKGNGADIIHGPEVRDLYGMKEIAVRDPDGHMLVFAEDTMPE